MRHGTGFGIELDGGAIALGSSTVTGVLDLFTCGFTTAATGF